MMSTEEQKKQIKARLRKEVRRAEENLSPEEKKVSDALICKALLLSPEYLKAKTVFCFAGTKREIDTMPFIRQAIADGKTVSVPLCTGVGTMRAGIITSPDDLSPGAFGIPEPCAGAEELLPGQIDLAVIPCLSCSRDGRRLGQGGGFYDRFLPGLKGDKIMIVREKLMREDIPAEEHDAAVDSIITEKGFILKGGAEALAAADIKEADGVKAAAEIKEADGVKAAAEIKEEDGVSTAGEVKAETEV